MNKLHNRPYRAFARPSIARILPYLVAMPGHQGIGFHFTEIIREIGLAGAAPALIARTRSRWILSKCGEDTVVDIMCCT